MGVAIPDEIQYLDAGILVIEGGSNRNTEYDIVYNTANISGIRVV